MAASNKIKVSSLNTFLAASVRVVLIVLVFVLLTLGFAKTIKLTGTDVGRHLKNGEVYMTGGGIPATNFYSYTAPDYPVVNHHWASGVVFYLVKEWCGFTGLSLFFIAIMLTSCALIFYLSWRTGSFVGAVMAFILLVPLILERTEIRPEGFSYLLCALFSVIIYLVKQRAISRYSLLVLPVLEVLWVNLHIYFVIGIFIIGAHLSACLLDLCIKKRSTSRGATPAWLQVFTLDCSYDACWSLTKRLGAVLLLAIVAAFINPCGVRGALEPFTIFTSYGYLIVENQSVVFLARVLALPVLTYFMYCLVAVGALTLIWMTLAIKRGSRIAVAELVIGAVFTLMATLALRNFTIFGLYAAPLVSAALAMMMAGQRHAWRSKLIYFVGIMLGAVLVLNGPFIQARFMDVGIGLDREAEGPIDFFHRQSLQGPVFNNYDIGGLLIYGLYPREKAFVDNRPEAYPASFFTKILIPMQQDEGEWLAQDQQYGFNVIIFSYRDYTPWGQQFITKRVADPAWVPVYADTRVIILVKDNVINHAVIARFAMDRNMFKVRSTDP